MSHEPTEYDRYFSLEEARELLDTIEPMVDEIIEIRHDLDAKGFDIVRGEFVRDPQPGARKEVRDEVERVQDLLESIHETGALYKDPRFELGMVDFPHVRDGSVSHPDETDVEDVEVVELCWMHGEEDIMYWHPSDEGMDGRRPIEEL